MSPAASNSKLAIQNPKSKIENRQSRNPIPCPWQIEPRPPSPEPCTLLLVPYTLYPIPHTLYHHTRHPIPHTLLYSCCRFFHCSIL